MEWIKTWAMSLSMVIVFGTLIETILPNGNYRKYIHLILGILLLISIITPIAQLFDGELSFELTDDENGVYEISREKLEYKQQKDVIDIFKRTIESNLMTRLETKLPELKGKFSVKVTAEESSGDFGRITHAAVMLDSLPHSVTEEEIRNLTAEILGLAAEDVAVVT